jgi:hypothetical protein
MAEKADRMDCSINKRKMAKLGRKEVAPAAGRVAAHWREGQKWREVHIVRLVNPKCMEGKIKIVNDCSPGELVDACC